MNLEFNLKEITIRTETLFKSLYFYHFPQRFAQLDHILWVSNTIYPVNKKRSSCVKYESGCVTCSFLVIKTENALQSTTGHVVCSMTYSRTASSKFHWLSYTISITKTSLVIREYCFMRYFTNFLAEDIGLDDLFIGYIIKRYNTRFRMINKFVRNVSLAQNCSVDFAVLFCWPNNKHWMPTGIQSPAEDGSSIVCTNLFNLAGSESLINFNKSLYLTYKRNKIVSDLYRWRNRSKRFG